MVYANSAWSSVANGADPDGAGPATAMGTDAFSDIASAEAAVADRGTVYMTGSFAGSDIAVNHPVTLDGQNQTTVTVPDSAQVNAFDVTADNVTIENTHITGPVSSSYLTYSWGSNISRGIAVTQGVTGFTITGDTIDNLRNDILIDGRGSTGSVTHNTIDNSKSGISVQYTDASGITISGNAEGSERQRMGGQPPPQRLLQRLDDRLEPDRHGSELQLAAVAARPLERQRRLVRFRTRPTRSRTGPWRTSLPAARTPTRAASSIPWPPSRPASTPSSPAARSPWAPGRSPRT